MSNRIEIALDDNEQIIQTDALNKLRQMFPNEDDWDTFVIVNADRLRGVDLDNPADIDRVRDYHTEWRDG
jgi:hypothetical protein